jgi:hypothetical protein
MTKLLCSRLWPRSQLNVVVTTVLGEHWELNRWVLHEVWVVSSLWRSVASYQGEVTIGGSLKAHIHSTKQHEDSSITIWRCICKGCDERWVGHSPHLPIFGFLTLDYLQLSNHCFKKKSSTSILDILIKEEQAWNEYPVEWNNRVFLTHQSCMVEITRLMGSTSTRSHISGRVFYRDLPEFFRLWSHNCYCS